MPYVGCNTLLSANLFRCLNWSFAWLDEKNHIRGSDSGAAGVFGSETHLWLARLVRAREGRDALLPVGTCEGKPGAPQELFHSLPSA